MLETKNLTKVYKPKKGVPVTALDGVSLKFPERGMVFLLGKSGSGKSTLLNLLGGLDKYDEGEIIIKGVSSADFTQTRFDSYRNTYVGFIFQEYNILEEFNVGANIALALELQGKKATDEEINRILHEVDLVGYGSRKPNELSGGQLQRVAIARALVKNPEIIMADEPTGALDSNTGKQVFDTLKKLSANKLVIIVSHDREYAEHYADRIIELSDGKVLSDVEYSPENGGVEEIVYSGDVITIPDGYHLTEEDRLAINDHIDRIKSGVKLHFSGLKKKFRPTDESTIPSQDPSAFALIKSKLPLKSAFRIGKSSLKHKKFRLAVTILLSVVAFTLFALVDTFGAYDHVKVCTNSLVDSDISYASVRKSGLRGEGVDSYWSTWGYKLTREDVEEISEATGVDMRGVYVPDYGSLSFDDHTDFDQSLYTESGYTIHTFGFSGFAELTDSDVDALGYEIVAGKLPDGGKDEIAITKYVYETFGIGGYRSVTEEWSGEYEKIKAPSDMIGRTIVLNNVEYIITGVVDTKFDLSRYESITEETEGESTTNMLVDYFLYSELDSARSYSLNAAAIVGTGGIDRLLAKEPVTVMLRGSYCNFYSNTSYDTYAYIDPSRIGKLTDLDPDTVFWRDGTPRTELSEKELVVTTDCLYSDSFYADGGVIVEGGIVTEDGEFIEYDYSVFFEYMFDGYASSPETDWHDISGYEIVGVIDTAKYPEASPNSIYTCDEFYEEMTAGMGGEFEYAVGAMPETKGDVEKLVEYCYRDDTKIRFPLQNAVTFELDTVDETLNSLSAVFLWIGVGFAGFASAMLANFIGTSIAYKKQEIGILRAIGSRSNDVFRIFFSESFIIAMINFTITVLATFAITTAVNMYVRENIGLLITVLTFGIRQIALVFVVSVSVAAASSYLPVKKIASKRPIDAIRDR